MQDPTRPETDQERYDVRFAEMCAHHRVLEEFASWFGGDRCDVDAADSEGGMSDLRAIVAWLNAAPEDIKRIAIAGMRRNRIGMARYMSRTQPALEIMGEMLPAVKGEVR